MKWIVVQAALIVFPFLQMTARDANDTIFVYQSNGDVFAFPRVYIDEEKTTEVTYSLALHGDFQYSYPIANIDSISNVAPDNLPRMTSFKINNKYNNQVHYDIDAQIREEGLIHLSVPAIGKRLTPSFKLSDDRAVAYVDDEMMVSKVSKLKFDGDVVYTIAFPNHHIWQGERMEHYGRRYTVSVDWPFYHLNEIPRIEITTNTGDLPKDKVTYIGAFVTFDGMGVLPTISDSVYMRGRGNSSWNRNNYKDKNPYRLKFSHKVAPFGLKKGKNWVLLSNRQTGSMTTNAIGMKIAQLVNTAAPNHIVPVELYINGEYRGNYNLTEKVGLSNNSVDLDDESEATLLEMDTRHDENMFWTSPYSLPVNIKKPDFEDDETTLTKAMIRQQFNQWVKKMYNKEDISELVDVEYLARFLFVNDLMRNCEINDPKSIFVYRPSTTEKYVFGPVWDFDWGFGYEKSKTYFKENADVTLFSPPGSTRKATKFIYDLRNSSAELNKAYCKLWKKFIENDYEELMEFCDDYYQIVRQSLEHNATKWKENTDYAASTEQAKSWLTTRSNYIYENEVYPDGDVNHDEMVSVSDVLMTIDHILGQEPSQFHKNAADMDRNGTIDVTDVVTIINKILGKE